MERKAALSLLFVGALWIAGCTGGSFSSTTPPTTITSVSVSCASTSIQTGQTSQCSAVVSGTGSFSSGVTWSAVSGTVNSSGLYTAPSTVPASGSDTIKATSTQDNTKFGTAVVSIATTVVQPTVTKVTVTAMPSSIATSQTATCTATVTGTGAYSSAVTWTATGGTITAAGVFTPSGTGTGSCIANSAQAGYTNISGSATITVTSPPPTVTGITVIASPSSITTAQTATCVATVTGTGAYSSAVTWTASGGTITQAGVFTPSGTGTGSCIANSAQAGYTNVSGSANITVTSPIFTVTGVTVIATPTSITTAQTSTCAATVSGTGAFPTTVTWTATGGTISAAGVFTPSGTGTAACTAHSAAPGYTNVSGSANITVTAAASTITAVSLVCSPLTITDIQTSTCTPTVTGTGAFANTVNLSVSPSAAGSLSASTGVTSGTGVVFTPPNTGAETATITATSTQDATKFGSQTITVTVSTGGPTCSGMSLGNGASLNGFVPFPATAAWNVNIASAPVDTNSAAIIAGFSGSNLHPDFSSVAGGNYGIPYVVVDSSTQPLVPITAGAYAGDSDVADAPFPPTAPIEGAPGTCVGGPNNYINDQHVLVLDRNRCMLYETFNTEYCNGTWAADSETIWDIQNFEQRPWGWTSADAAGLSVFPGLVRYDEVAAGVIKHAIRFTLQKTRSDSIGGYFVPPASHAAGNLSSSLNVEGMRIRLKASVDISSFSATNQVILTAMKQYGMILADNGSNLYFQGAPDPRWNDSDLSNLKTIPGSDFEVVQMTNPIWPGWDAASAPSGAAPTINSFTASASTVTAGTPVTLDLEHYQRFVRLHRLARRRQRRNRDHYTTHGDHHLYAERNQPARTRDKKGYDRCSVDARNLSILLICKMGRHVAALRIIASARRLFVEANIGISLRNSGAASGRTASIESYRHVQASLRALPPLFSETNGCRSRGRTIHQFSPRFAGPPTPLRSKRFLQLTTHGHPLGILPGTIGWTMGGLARR